MRPFLPGTLARLLLLVGTLGTGAAGAQDGRAQQRRTLRDISEGQPMRVEDAVPSEPGPQAELSFLSSDETGELGLYVQPQVSLGLRSKTEVGLSAG